MTGIAHNVTRVAHNVARAAQRAREPGCAHLARETGAGCLLGPRPQRPTALRQAAGRARPARDVHARTSSGAPPRRVEPENSSPVSRAEQE